MEQRRIHRDPRIKIKGKCLSRKITYNVEDILSLLQTSSLLFNEQALAIDPDEVSRLNEMVCSPSGKIMKFHGVIHVKFMPDGIVVGRFDLDEEDE